MPDNDEDYLDSNRKIGGRRNAAKVKFNIDIVEEISSEPRSSNNHIA